MEPQASGANASEPTANAEPEATTETTTTPQTERESVQYSTHERVLNESKKFKDRAVRAEQELETRKQKELEDQGKWKEVAEKQKERADNYHTQMIRDKVSTAIQTAAAKAGCIDPTALTKLGDGGLMQFDEDTQTVHGTELFIEDAKQKFGYLFHKPGTPTINPSAPAGVPLTPQPKTAAQIAAGPKDVFNKVLGAALSQAEKADRDRRSIKMEI